MGFVCGFTYLTLDLLMEKSVKALRWKEIEFLCLSKALLFSSNTQLSSDLGFQL